MIKGIFSRLNLSNADRSGTKGSGSHSSTKSPISYKQKQARLSILLA